MNNLKTIICFSVRGKRIPRLSCFTQSNALSTTANTTEVKVAENEFHPIDNKDVKSPVILKRNLQFPPPYVKPREVWIENFDKVKEEKRGLVELHPKIFGTMPRLDIIFDNIKWQNLYKNVVLFSAKTRSELSGGGRKPHPQKGLGKARQGSIRAPHMKGGGCCHGPRNPTTYFYLLNHTVRVHGLTSTLSAKFAQDDLHVIENINIPTADSQFILDLIKERNWGSSVLIVDDTDVMPRNITIATDSIDYVTLMPVYGLNVHSMLKHDTLVLTLAAVEEIEDKLINILHTANPLQLKKQFDSFIKYN